MARKGLAELTGHEVTILQAAARLLAAIRYRAEHPPPPQPSQATWDHLDLKVWDELVRYSILL